MTKRRKYSAEFKREAIALTYQPGESCRSQLSAFGGYVFGRAATPCYCSQRLLFHQDQRLSGASLYKTWNDGLGTGKLLPRRNAEYRRYGKASGVRFEYINRWSLWMDLKILAMTPLALLRDEAYQQVCLPVVSNSDPFLCHHEAESCGDLRSLHFVRDDKQEKPLR